jgi:activator of 2-hydroxyglutaryl-CoA dehydratase
MDKVKKEILLDFGTSYAKLEYVGSGRRAIIPTRLLLGNLHKYRITAATGHNAARHAESTANELVALAHGALALIPDRDFIVLDCGARDVKYIKVAKRKVRAMDWNTECGAFTGQVIELLSSHFDLEPSDLPVSERKLSVVCGVLGMTAIFDRIAQGAAPREAFAEFLRGVAFNCETLVGRPRLLYLSGGLCENPAFVNSFSCETRTLGRFVLLEGLKKSSGINKNADQAQPSRGLPDIPVT